MNERDTLIHFFKTGKLQKLVTREILKTLPKEYREQYKKEGVPEDVQAVINAEINQQLKAAGISIEEING